MAGKRGKQLTLDQQVLDFIQARSLTTDGQTLLAAVSGGQDSVCLLHILNNLQTILNIRLHVAHLDHQLRGKASAADARYVAALAKKLGIPCTIARRDVNAYKAAHGLSLEEAARAVRYGFLAEVAASIGAQSVAVGHTLDDQAETILLHLVRGTGTRGLRGLQPSAEWHADSQKLTVIRPLLEVRRAETGAYCADFNLKPRQDASNLSLEPLRNRVRLELLPLLNEYNPRMTEALQRTSALAGDDITHLQNEAAQLWLKIARIEGRAVMMDKQALLQLDLSMQRYVLRLAVEKAAGDLKDIEAQHIEALVQALAKPAGKKIILPYGLTFSVDYESFILVPTADNAASWPAPTGEYRLKIPGQTTVPGWKITARLARKPAAAAQNKNTVELDYAKTGGKLTVRARKNGDRFQPLGMPQTKNLAQFMLDAKIPQDLRDSIPLVVGETGIVWVGGCRVDERAKVTAETNQILRLKLEKI